MPVPSGAVTSTTTSTSVSGKRLPRSALLLSVLIGTAAAVISVLRFSAAGRLGEVMWAEDGMVFLSCEVGPDPLACIATPHQGYLQVAARLLAAPLTLVPATSAALWITVATSAAAGLVAGFITYRAQALPLPGTISAVSGLFLVVIPAYGAEVGGNLANLQWIMIPLGMWALLPRIRPEPRVADTCVDAAVVALVMLSAPGAVVLAPVALWRYLDQRTRDSNRWISMGQLPVIAFGVASLIAVGFFAAHRQDRNIPLNAEPVSERFADILQVFGNAFVFLDDENGEMIKFVGLAVAVAFVVAAAITLPRATVHQRLVVLVAAVSYTLMLALGVFQYGTSARYFYACLLLLWPAVAIFATVALTCFGRIGTLLVAACVGLAVVPLALTLAAPKGRLSGGDWPQEVAAAEVACAAGVASVDVHISPARWHVQLPCTYFR